MVFFSAVFAARAPAMGNSADRAWQLSQLVEGVSTAFNPSHSSLSCVETNCVSFASVQARKLNHSVCFSFPHEVGYFVGTPTMVGHCVSKQIGLPTVRFSLAGSLLPPGLRAPCASPNLRCCPRCWLFSCLGLWSHPHISPKEHQKERCDHSRSQRSFITFHGALRIILLLAGFPATFHMITSEQTFVNGPLQKKFLLLLLLNRIDSISNLYIFTYLYLYFIALDFPT